VKTQNSILVVDDEPVMCESLSAWLREDGHRVETAASGREAIDKARHGGYDVYFVDLKMPPGMDGIETMTEIRKLHSDASVIIITAYATVDTAIAAMKEGAIEYIVKPCNPQEISLLVARILELKNLRRENQYLRRKLAQQYSFHDLVSKNPRMLEIFELIRDVAAYRSTVLVEGESGTGKELLARAIHQSSDRADRPFVAVSCAALVETLLESELFGHERGSFTGAVARQRGKLELADGGDLFLDEIGDISPKLQMDLLRFLEERTFFRVGGAEQIRVDVRVIAATNRDLRRLVQEGRFRDDLFYRLNVIHIRIPPLRERREDVPLLAGQFAERIPAELGKPPVAISEGAIRTLLDHDWPGNVRELENAIERAIVTHRGEVLTAEDFAFLRAAGPAAPGWTPPTNQTLQEVERQVIEATLRRAGGNIKETAAILGIDRSTLYDKIKRYGIERPDPEERLAGRTG
jgi:DNA-binding NtrC family response regulator